MTSEEKRFDKNLTDEQAQARGGGAHPSGELSEEELNQVTGGYMSPAKPPKRQLNR